MRFLSALLLVCTLTSCSLFLPPVSKTVVSEIKEGQYQLDPQHTTLLFKVDHMGFSTFVGRFNRYEASLDFDPEDIVNAKLEARVEMASVDVNNEAFERALRGSFWFDSEDYPYATFKTLSAKKIAAGDVEFLGEMTFLGVTKPISLVVKFNGAGNNLLNLKYTLGFSASTKFKRSDFGLDRYIPTVGDEIELEIHAEFQKR